MFDISWLALGRVATHALLTVLINPLLYVGWILYAIALGQEAKHQRRFFGVRLTRVRSVLWAQMWRSLLAGLVLSLGADLLGVVIHPADVWLFSGVVLLVMCLRLRFGAAIPAIGALLVLSALARSWRPSGLAPQIDTLWRNLAALPSYAWLCLAALLCLVEFVLLATRKAGVGHSIQVESKRGRVIGAVSMQLMYSVPVIVWVAGGELPRTGAPASWPWLGAWAGGLGMVGVPFLLGMGGVFTAAKPQSVIRTSALHALLSAIAVGLGAALALWHPNCGWIGGVIALFSREPVILLFKQWENQREPLYVPSTKGVRVLEVVGGSLAEAIGIHAGEIITHVNQVPVHTEYDLHFACSQNPAYAKLHVMDERGEVRILGGAVYDGERAKLGVIGTPEGMNDAYYTKSRFGLLQSLYMRLYREDEGSGDAVGSSMGT